MKSLTKKEWVKRIDEIVLHYFRLSEICEQAQKLGVMDINGALHEVMWDAFQSMLRMLDYNGWIEWHIYENDCGDKATEASHDGNMKPIRTSENLADLIVAGTERNEQI